MSPRLLAATVLLSLSLGACAPAAPPIGGPAPDVEVQTMAGPLRLSDLRGQQVVVQFAPADSVEAWATLAAAAADLQAEGALVIGIATDGTPPESPFRTGRDTGRAAAAFGYTGVPLAVIIDREGVLRGLAAPRHADDLFALAAPVLLESDTDDAPSVPVDPVGTDAADVQRLVRHGAALIDLRDAAVRDAEGFVRYALICPIDRFAADVLPADVGTPVVLIGPDAAAAAEQAAGWGYRNIHVVADALDVAEPRSAAPARPTPPAAPTAPRRAAVRG